MKGLTLILLLAVPCFVCAQGVFTNQTHQTLQKVINDFPNHFRNIKGRLIEQNPQTTDFASTIQIPGSLNTIITKYTSSDAREEIYSWKCIMLETDNFDEVTKKYKLLYNEIKNSIIKLDGNKPFILSGSYVDPTEEKRFTATAFTLVPASGDLKKLKVELTLEYLVTEWTLSIVVYDKPDQEELAMDWSTD
jgi:hypothetical protein